MKWCPKRPYKTARAARKALHSCQRRRDTKHKEQRHYRCHICRVWHLASKEDL